MKIPDLIETTRENYLDCHTVRLDLSSVELKVDEDSMGLVCPMDGKLTTYYFKKVGTDPDAAHAAKQFCKAIGVPYSYFTGSRPSLRDKMFKQNKVVLEPGSKVYNMKVRRSESFSTIRAILPTDYVSLDTQAVLQVLKGAVEIPHKVIELDGAGKDDLVFYIRVMMEEGYRVKEEEYRYGFTLISSDMGASNLILDLTLYHVESDTYYVSTHGPGSYLNIKCGGMQEFDLKEFLGTSVKNVLRMGVAVKDIISDSLPFIGVKESCRIVSQSKLVPGKVKREVSQEALGSDLDIRTNFEFAQLISRISRKYEFKKRLGIERLAGSFLGDWVNNGTDGEGVGGTDVEDD